MSMVKYLTGREDPYQLPNAGVEQEFFVTLQAGRRLQGITFAEGDMVFAETNQSTAPFFTSINVQDGFSNTNVSQFTSAQNNIRDMDFFLGDLFTINPTTITRLSETTSTVVTTFAPIGSVASAIAHIDADLLSVSRPSSTHIIHRRSGISSTVLATVNFGATAPVGITCDGVNLITGQTSGTIIIHDGFSGLNLRSFAAPYADLTSLAFDGRRLVTGYGNGRVVQHKKG